MNRDDCKTNEDALARRAKIKKPAKKGSTLIDHKYCKGCGLCISVCPTGALLFHDTPTSRWGVEVVADSPDYCTCCGRCETSCPDFAIFTYKTEESNNEKAV